MRNIYANKNHVFQREIAKYKLVPAIKDINNKEKVIFISYDKIIDYFPIETKLGWGVKIVTNNDVYFYPSIYEKEIDALKLMKNIALIGVGFIKLSVLEWLGVLEEFSEEFVNVII